MSKVITPEAILSYPHLFKPQPPMEDGGKEKFGAVLVFGPDTDLKPMKDLAIAVAKEKWGDKTAEMIQKGKLRMPFRDDDDKGYPAGSIFISPRSLDRPGVVSVIPDPELSTPERQVPSRITDPAEIWAGCIVRASLGCFAYDVAGNKGVSFALNNVQKIREGERMDGRVKAEDEFDADKDAVASLDDLTEDSGDAPAEADGEPLDLAALI